MKLTNFEKLYKDWKWSFILVFVCLAGIPLTIIYGIQSVNWGNDFWPNALSEFLGMFVDLLFGALFTFIVIDKYTQYHKAAQWSKIKRITYKNLYFILSNIILKLNLSLPKEKRVEYYFLTEDIETLNDYLPKSDFDTFVDSLTGKLNGIIQEKCVEHPLSSDTSSFFEDEPLHLALMKFKQHTKVDINNLSSLIIHKMLSFSDNINLINEVIELEELFLSLMSKIKTVHSKSNIDIKCIWLLKLQEILQECKEISALIKDEINID